MATYTKTVDPNGSANYTSLAAWEAGEQTLYSSGDIAVADCRRTGSAKDTTTCLLAGWTAGVTPKIIVNESYRHEGKWADQRASDSNYIYQLEVANANCINNQVVGTEVIGLCCRTHTATANGKYTVIHVADGKFLLDSCIVRGQASATYWASCCYLYAATLTNAYAIIRNCLVYDNHTTATAYYSIQIRFAATAPASEVSNCTVIGTTGIGMGCVNSPLLAQNNLFQGFTDGYYGTTYTAGSTNNCSSVSGDAPGSNAVTGTATFVDAANGDWHLAATDTVAKGAGANLYSSFTTDIDGQTRPASGAWCIGCDEYVSGGSPLAIEGTFAGSIVSSLAAAGQLGTAGTMSAATGIQGALSGKIGVGGTTAVSVGTFLAASGREGKQGSLTTTIELLAALFGSTGLIETFTGTLDAAIESVASEMTGNAGTSGELVGQILTAAALVGALGVSGDASLDLTDLSGLLTGAIGVSGPWNISVSCGSELAGALGVSGEIIGAVGFLGLRLIEITGDSTVYRILFASKTGGIIMTTRTGTIEWR